jgi:NhaA family Na+:H+ antiporter
MGADTMAGKGVGINLKKAEQPHRSRHVLHKPVTFGIRLGERWFEGLTTANSLGLLLGLFVGEPLGIPLARLIAVKTGLSRLAFHDPDVVQNTKISVLLSSLLAGLAGFTILRRQISNNSS